MRSRFETALPKRAGKTHNYGSFTLCIKLTMFICIYSFNRLLPSVTLSIFGTPRGTTPNRYLKPIIYIYIYFCIRIIPLCITLLYTTVYITTSLNRPSLVSLQTKRRTREVDKE